MPEQPGAGRLDPETLAAYIDGLLPPEERARVDAEIAADPETYEWVVNSIGAVDDPAIATPAEPVREPAPVPALTPEPVPDPAPHKRNGVERKMLPFHRRRGVQGLLGTFLAAAAALVMVVRTQPVWWQEVWGPAVDPRFAKLVEAVGEERYIEARLTGGFKYGPLRQVMRGPGDLSNQNLQLLAAAGELQKAAEQEPSVVNLHALGIAYLLAGDVRAGIEALERAESAGSPSAALLSDLSAAYLLRADLSARPEDLPRALDAAERALVLAPASPESLFNRALALQKLALADASSAWRVYLEVDGRSPWAEEAKRHLEAVLKRSGMGLSREAQVEWTTALEVGSDADVVVKLASMPRWRLRQFTETTLLRSWSSQVAGATAGVPQVLRLLGTTSGVADPALVELSKQALAACALSPRSCRQFAAGHAAFSEAALLQAQELFVDSVSLAERAVSDLVDLDSPLANAARLLAARAQLRVGRARDARIHLATILKEGQRDPVALAGATAQLGILAFSAGDLAVAKRLYTQHLEIASAAGDPSVVVMAHAMLGIYYRYVGETAAAWSEWHAASASVAFADPRPLHAWLIAMVNASHSMGLSHAALTLSEALISNSRGLHPGASIEALSARARVLSALARHEELPALFSEAHDLLSRIADPAFRERIRLQLLTAEAEVRVDDPGVALRAARDAIDIVEDGRETLRLAQLNLFASRAATKLGLLNDASSALAAGLEAFEIERSSLSSELRISYFDKSWKLFSDRVEAALIVGNNELAFLAFQDSRARTLAEARQSAGKRWTLGETSLALRPREALLLISQFVDRLALIVVTAGGHTVHWVDMPAVAAQALVRRLTIGAGIDRTAAERGYELLVKPLGDAISGIDALWIVPDVPYYAIPFPALVDSRTGRFLVESVEVVVSPSLEFALSRRDTIEQTSSATIVGISSQVDRDLPPLPFAVEEARAIAALYSQSRLFVDDEATVSAVLPAMTGAHVIHIAAHAVANEERPMLSHLRLFDSDDRSGALFAQDIAVARLSKARVAVLAACGTGAGAVRNGEGPLSLARAVLGAGVDNVIATLTDVPDEWAAKLSVAVHERLSVGMTPAAALRAAQVAAIAQNWPTAAWGRTLVVGSGK